MRIFTVTALAVFIASTAHGQGAPNPLPKPTLDVNIANQPIEVTGEVEAVVDEPLQVEGAVDVSGSTITVDNDSTNPVSVTVENAAAIHSIQFLAIGATVFPINGARGGISGLHDYCQARFKYEYPKVRTCTTVEAAATPDIGAITDGLSAWVQPVVVTDQTIFESQRSIWHVIITDQTGLRRDGTATFFDQALYAGDLNCRNWTSGDDEPHGAVVLDGRLTTDSCSSGHVVLCCAPAQ